MTVWLTGVRKSDWRRDESAWAADVANVFGAPKRRLPTRISCCPEKGQRTGQRLGRRYAQGGHEVSAMRGAGKQTQAAAVKACMRISRPTVRTGHRRGCSAESE